MTVSPRLGARGPFVDCRGINGRCRAAALAPPSTQWVSCSAAATVSRLQQGSPFMLECRTSRVRRVGTVAREVPPCSFMFQRSSLNVLFYICTKGNLHVSQRFDLNMVFCYERHSRESFSPKNWSPDEAAGRQHVFSNGREQQWQLNPLAGPA